MANLVHYPDMRYGDYLFYEYQSHVVSQAFLWQMMTPFYSVCLPFYQFSCGAATH